MCETLVCKAIVAIIVAGIILLVIAAGWKESQK